MDHRRGAIGPAVPVVVIAAISAPMLIGDSRSGKCPESEHRGQYDRLAMTAPTSVAGGQPTVLVIVTVDSVPLSLLHLLLALFRLLLVDYSSLSALLPFVLCDVGMGLLIGLRYHFLRLRLFIGHGHSSCRPLAGTRAPTLSCTDANAT